MFTFVNTNSESLNKSKRKGVQRACDTCRRRKKRCYHHTPATKSHRLTDEHISSSTHVNAEPPGSTPAVDESQDDDTVGVTEDDVQLSNERRSLPTSINSIELDIIQQQSSQSRADPVSHHSHGADSTFIGDMNPEGVFLEVNNVNDAHPKQPRTDIGLWLPQNINHPAVSSGRLKQNKSVSPASLFYGFSSPLQQVFLPLLEEECLSTYPPATERVALCTIYFEKFQPILPIIDLHAYQSLNSGTSEKVLLEQGMCLVASTDPGSKSLLHLPGVDSVLSREDFSQRILASMKILIEIATVTDRITLIRALLFMWHFNRNGQCGEDASSIVSKAVQYTYSIGLHAQSRGEDSENGLKGTLFSCVWAVDRLNAMIHGRSILMHERDIGQPLQDCFAAQPSAFRLLLDVISLLNRTISLYRPITAKEDFDQEFELYEDILARCEISQVPVSQLITIEILYHTIAILSCRFRMNEHSNSDLRPTNSSRTRQALSTRRVTAMVGHEYSDLVILFPFVPYAVSLCLSVAYREMRRSTISVSRARARIAFEENCQILDRLGTTFGQAAAMAVMARATLAELDRVVSSIVENPRRRRSVALITSNNDLQQDSQGVIPTLDGVATDGTDLEPDTSTNLLYHPEMFDLNLFDMFTPSFDLDHIDACLEGNLDLGISSSMI